MPSAQFVQQFAGAFGLGVGHARHGFVQQQQLGFLHQQHADLQPLLLAMRQQAGGPPHLGPQPDQVQRFADLVGLFAGQPREQRGPHALVGLHRQFQVFEHGVLFEHSGALELAADARMRDLRLVQGRKVDALAEEGGARRWPRLAGDDVHHRGLARAVGADDAAH
ncbi:hypothetical protein G6F65_021638 [Rhizopus arrhizus]|nr:hypothetical protein G6F65_021638 [Rhizopus arrhizus]